VPIYRCFSPTGLLTKSEKSDIAEQVTTIHCDATNAPRSFVNVVFTAIDSGDCFVAGETASRSYIFGDIRHDRDLATRQSMLHKLSHMWTHITGQPQTELIVVLTEIDPANSIEAGEIVPEPGDEQQWLDHLGSH
jgi:phenylpyruvate tautomerase PptA (4-oxalocrotonate tautomerase family)